VLGFLIKIRFCWQKLNPTRQGKGTNTSLDMAMASSSYPGSDNEFLPLGKIDWRWVGRLADVGMIIPKIIGKWNLYL
jgi:hypothetical protein